jgi:hypothetical protein
METLKVKSELYGFTTAAAAVQLTLLNDGALIVAFI